MLTWCFDKVWLLDHRLAKKFNELLLQNNNECYHINLMITDNMKEFLLLGDKPDRRESHIL